MRPLFGVPEAIHAEVIREALASQRAVIADLGEKNNALAERAALAEAEAKHAKEAAARAWEKADRADDEAAQAKADMQRMIDDLRQMREAAAAAQIPGPGQPAPTQPFPQDPALRRRPMSSFANSAVSGGHFRPRPVPPSGMAAGPAEAKA